MDMKSIVLHCIIFSISFSNSVEGCVETFPLSDDSNTECSNLATTCSVVCSKDYIFYDGNSRKNYTCDRENIWTPAVPKFGCVEKDDSWYQIRLSVVYKSHVVASSCLQAHQADLLKNKENITANVFGFCNYGTIVAAGNVVIGNITSWTESLSYNIHSALDLIFTNHSTSTAEIEACAWSLKVNIGKLMLRNDVVECENQSTSNLTLQTEEIQTEITVQCKKSFLSTTTGKHDYCVLDIPVVGGAQFLYSAYEHENITLICKILFGTSINRLYWTHKHQNITLSSNTKYSGGTETNPSLTIHNLTQQDYGEYECYAVNSNGRGVGPNIFLEVFAKPAGEVTTQQDQSTATSFNTSPEGQLITQQDEGTATSLNTSPETQNTDRTTRNNTEEDTQTILYIAIGAGCGGLLIIIIILVIVIKSCRHKSHSKERKTNNRKPQSYDENDEPEYDGLKENILYVKSDDGLKDNILYVPSEEHDIADGNYSSVDLEHSTVKRVSVDGNYTTVDLESPRNNPGSSHTTKGSNNSNETTKFVNQAFEINDGDITHIAAPDGTSNVYAVVNKKKNSVKNSDDQNIPKPEITYAVVNKTSKPVRP